MFTERHIVDNRVFLLGLDKLYRDAMKDNERTELLPSGRDVLSQALLDTEPPEWTVANLTEAAHNAAFASDDISLVGPSPRRREVSRALRDHSICHVCHSPLSTTIGSTPVARRAGK